MATNEAICQVVGCWCGAKPGEYCIGKYGRATGAGSRHADRTVSARQWRQANPDRWVKLKDEIFRILVKASGQHRHARKR